MTERRDKYNSDRYSRESSRKRSRHHSNYDSLESKTPPLPQNHASVKELIKKRDSIRKELKKFEEVNIEREVKTHKKYKKYKYEKETTNNVRVAIATPQNSQDYTELDSEDEERLIEQRRQQRKQLIQQLSKSQEKVDLTFTKEDKSTNENLELINRNESLANENTNILINKKDVPDMFSEDDFVPKNKGDYVIGDISKDSSQLHENWDDGDGYYNIKVGDIIYNKRYKIKSLVGQGVFANVVKAQDSETCTEVAIKIVRNNELMYKTGLKEAELLQQINGADPKSQHCVKFLLSFMHKGHLCLVLEPLHMDLRTIIKKYGRNHGISMKALMSYSRQLLLSLKLLNKVGIVHADIKPDNILVTEKKNILKLFYFGSAMKANDNEPTPYLVSRFYRAPEIILGIGDKHSIDVWSTACTIFEMSTGKILFTGSNNNGMLKCFMDLKGRIPTRLLKRGKFKDQHFNYNNNFLFHKKDEFTGRTKVVELTNITTSRDLLKELKQCSEDPNCEKKKMTQLKDLLDKMLTLDPNQRLSVTDCINHPFIKEEL